MKEQAPDPVEALGGSLTPGIVGQELVKAGVVPDLDGFRLEPIPRNQERRDYLTRASFRVRMGEATVCHLTVGANLEDLWRRSKDFAGACPEITARPLFLHRAGSIDYLGIEYIEGTDFETLERQGLLKATKARALIERLVTCLEGTLQDSTVSAVSKELDGLFASLCESPLFGALDQRFLQDLVFPFIRQGARGSPAQTRWTNGDFIPGNVRIDLQGHPRLIDYEFACRTHFHGEDALRWSFFSKELPKEVRSLAPFGDSTRAGDGWMEGYFLLRQVLLSWKTSGSKIAVGNTAVYVRDRLLRLVSGYHNGFRSSLFYEPMFAQLRETVESSPRGMAQLFWSPDGTFGEEKSCRLQLPHERGTLLRFKLPPLSGPLHLRFDPVDAAGLIHISALRVYVPSTGRTLLAITGQTVWQGLRPHSGLRRLTDTSEFNLLSWNTDPILLLPALDLGPIEREIAVDVGMRFTPDLEGLSALLASPAPAELARTPEQLGAAEAAGAVSRSEIGVPEADLVTESIRVAELRQSLAQIEEGGRNLAAVEANAAALQTDLLTAGKTFHEALQGRSREMMELAEKNSAYVESLLAQNDEIRRLEAVNRLAGEALLELRDQLTAAQRWLGELRNRALVRLSLMIHREKWPL